MVYLDYNATTPVDSRVIEAMTDVYMNHPGNASSRTHLIGDDCRKIVEKAREQVAALAGVNPTEVIFTCGATESDNIALRGLAEYGQSTNRKHVLISAIEHKAVINAALGLEREGFEIERIPVDQTGALSLPEVKSRLRQDTLLVSVMHVNNETGIIQPVRELGELISSEYPNTFFHIDAAQSFGKLVDEIGSLTYDMMSVTAHKMYGPQGIGALILRQRGFLFPPIKPLLFGGGQERGISPGTQPVALIAGFGKSAELCACEWKSDYILESSIKKSLIDALETSGIHYNVNGLPALCTPNCTNISFDGVSSEALMIATKRMLAISNGSACTSSSYEPSYVLMAMGLGVNRSESAIRVSWGRMTEPDKAEAAFTHLINSALNLQGAA
jgi:cysteine desulfurase